jgi:hypothetical protein
MVDAVALAVADSLLKAVAGTGFAFKGPGVNRCSISGKSKTIRFDQALPDGMIQEQGLKDVKEPFGRSEILRRLDLKSFKEIIDSDFFNWRCLLTLLLGVLWFLFRRVDWGSDIVLIRIPEPAGEVIERTDAGRIANHETGKDCIQMVLLELGRPVGE